MHAVGPRSARRRRHLKMPALISCASGPRGTASRTRWSCPDRSAVPRAVTANRSAWTPLISAGRCPDVDQRRGRRGIRAGAHADPAPDRGRPGNTGCHAGSPYGSLPSRPIPAAGWPARRTLTCEKPEAVLRGGPGCTGVGPPGEEPGPDCSSSSCA